MNMRVDIGGVKITSEKMDKLKNSDDISSALTLWEKIKKFFHVGNIEEKENILSLIKDVFINNDLNLYQKVGKFEEIKSLTKTQEAKDFFKIEIIDESLCLSIGSDEEYIKHIFTKDKDIVEINKLKNIQDKIIIRSMSENHNLSQNDLFKYLILLVNNQKEPHFFDEYGGLNIDNVNIENLRMDLINTMSFDIIDIIKNKKIDTSIYNENMIESIGKIKNKLTIKSEYFLKELKETVNKDRVNNKDKTSLENIETTVKKDLPRMDFFMFNKKIKDGEFDRLSNFFREIPNEGKELIYNLISQGVFQLVKNSLRDNDPLIVIGGAPLDGKSEIFIDKDNDNSINIRVINKKMLETVNRKGIKNASIFLSKYIDDNSGLIPYTQDHVNLLRFLVNNFAEKPYDVEGVLKVIDKNEESRILLEPSQHVTMLEEGTQLTFKYDLKNNKIIIDENNSFYEYSYLNI